MKCVMCGRIYDAKQAKSKCGKCSISEGCKSSCCPYCGYHNPIEPDHLKVITEFFKGLKKKHHDKEE